MKNVICIPQIEECTQHLTIKLENGSDLKHQMFAKAWFTSATKAEAQTNGEIEESFCSGVNPENGDGNTSGCSTEAEMERTDRSFFFRRLFCFCRTISHTSKCEPVMTETQAEKEGWAVSASVAGVIQALLKSAIMTNIHTLSEKPLISTLFLASSDISQGLSFHTWAAMLYSSIRGSCAVEQRSKQIREYELIGWPAGGCSTTTTTRLILHLYYLVYLACHRLTYEYAILKLNKKEKKHK